MATAEYIMVEGERRSILLKGCVCVCVCVSACVHVLWGEEEREMVHHYGEHPRVIRQTCKGLRQVT